MATFGYANKPYLPAALQQQMLLDPRYQMASQLAKTDTSPVASPLAGIARMLSGALGGYQLGKVQQEYQKQGEGYNQALAQALRAGQQGVKGWVDPDTGQQAIPDVAPGKDAMMTAISMSGNPMLQEEASRAQMASMLKGGDSEFERSLNSSSLTSEQKEAMRRRYLETKAMGALTTVFDPRTGQNVFGHKTPGGQPEKKNEPTDQPPKKSLPVGALKLQSELLDAYNAAGKIDADMGAIIGNIEQGELNLGPVQNQWSKLRNLAGYSDENSRNFATFGSELERMRNESLRINKGVQTEGDAQRAWNEILQNINDEELVIKRLREVRAINQRARELKALEIDNIRANYGADPLDYGAYQKGPAIMGEGRSPGGNTPAAAVNANSTAAQAVQDANIPREGDSAVNPKTGERIVFRNGQWGPE